MLHPCWRASLNMQHIKPWSVRGPQWRNTLEVVASQLNYSIQSLCGVTSSPCGCTQSPGTQRGDWIPAGQENVWFYVALVWEDKAFPSLGSLPLRLLSSLGWIIYWFPPSRHLCAAAKGWCRAVMLALQPVGSSLLSRERQRRNLMKLSSQEMFSTFLYFQSYVCCSSGGCSHQTWSKFQLLRLHFVLRQTL